MITLQALDKKYPASELLLALQTVVEEADKCQMVAHQLASTQGKVIINSIHMVSINVVLVLVYLTLDCVHKDTDYILIIQSKYLQLMNRLKEPAHNI